MDSLQVCCYCSMKTMKGSNKAKVALKNNRVNTAKPSWNAE